MSLPRKRLLVFFIPLVLSLPFLNRAVFVDDQFFIRIADWLKDHPDKPYDFDRQNEKSGHPVSREQLLTSIVNPLLHHYYLALLLKVGGMREWFLRLGGVLVSCISAVFIFELARRWTRHPFIATSMIFLTPAQWLSSHSLLIDPTMSCMFMGGIYFFIRSIEKEAFPLVVVSGLFMGLALLTKYTAGLVLVLSMIWFLMNKSAVTHKWRWSVSWGIAVGLILSYMLLTKNMYGKDHLTAASAVTLHWPQWGRTLVMFVFLSGTALTPVICWGIIPLRRSVGAAILAVLLAILFASPWGGVEIVPSLLLSFFIVTTLLLFQLIYEIQKRRELLSDKFIFYWGILFVSMMSVVMQWVAARYFIIVLPAVVFSTVRIVEIIKPERASRILKGALVPLFIFGFGLAFADYQQAESGRFIVKELSARGLDNGDRQFILGEAFTMFYLRQEGWSFCPSNSELKPGDRILVSEVTMPLRWFLRRRIPVRSVAQIDYPTRFPIKIMDSKGGASFYASVWGPLPFSISSGPWERFQLFEVIDPVRNY